MNIFEPKPYPSISQSIGITFIVIFGMLLFAPIMFLGDLIGPDTALFIYYVFAVGVPFWVVYTIRNRNSEKIVFNVEMGSTKIVLLIILTTIAIQNAITMPLMELIPMPDSIKEMFNNMFGNPRNIFSILTIVVAAPIFEELIFRGIILDGLLKRYSPVKAIIVSSALFGAVHLNPWQFVGAFILGIFIGWIYYKTKSITLAIAIHAFNNLTASLFMYFDTEKELVDKSMVDILGGRLNLIIYVIAFLGILAAALHFLNKEFKGSNHFNRKENEIDVKFD
jgi:membrane protease YdiL (CAAX protease family)